MEILRLSKIAESYYSNATVKIDEIGNYHIYYGGVRRSCNKKNNLGHGHMVIDSSGNIHYHRMPFSRRGYAEWYGDDGRIIRSKKFRKKFQY